MTRARLFRCIPILPLRHTHMSGLVNRHTGPPYGTGIWASCTVVRVARTRRSPVAQLAEQPAVNRQVFGSSPNGGASPTSPFPHPLRDLGVVVAFSRHDARFAPTATPRSARASWF